MIDLPWRLRDKIWEDLMEAPAAPTSIKMSKVTSDKLAQSMNMIGEIYTLFGLSVIIDNTIVENEWEFV